MSRSLPFTLALALVASPLGAQEAPPASPSPPAGEASGSTPAAGGPFASPLTLDAQPLRGLAAGVASQILTGERGGALALRVLGVPVPGEIAPDAARQVMLYVEIDGASLLEALPQETARLELYGYVLTPTGTVAAHLAEVFTLDVAAIGEAVWQTGLQYVGAVAVAPGDYVVRVLVRARGVAASGLDSSVLHVPAAGEPTVVALFPLPADRDGWVPVRGSGMGEDRPRFVVAGREVRPTALPVLSAGEETRFYLFSSGPIGETAGKATVELQRGEQVVETLPLHVEPGPHDAPLHGRPASFVLGEVEASAYRFFARPAAAARSGGQEIAVAPPRTGALLWTDLRLGSVAAVEAAQAAVAERERERLGRREQRRQDEESARAMNAEYRAALGGLSASGGESWGTRTALLDFESRALAATEDVERLREVERAVAEELAERDPESLVPLIEIHTSLYRAYRDRRRFALSTNARLHAEWLAELYAETVGTPGAHVVAARALASLAGYLQEAALPTASRRLYEQALVHEPTNETALLGLATGFERYGEYAQATSVLRRLLEIRPGLPEARLRLAVNQARTGDRTAAVANLRELLAPPTPDWVRTLAYEELARQWVEAGDVAAAVEVLSAGSRELGDPPGILLLLAHLLDRQEQPHQATGVLSRLTARRSGDAPRKRYDGWPEAALAETRRELSAIAAARIPLLHAGLGVAG